MSVVIKYSRMQMKRMFKTNKVIFIHSVLLIPGMGIIIYIFKDYLIPPSDYTLSYLLFIMFLFQTALIVGKRFKNEFYFSSRSFSLFPQNKVYIFLYTLIFGIIDINILLMLFVSLVTMVYVSEWKLLIIIIYSVMFVLCEITYIIYMMITIDIMTEKYGNSKNLFLVTFSLFFLIELFTRLTEKFYLFNYYPISGWIGSAVYSAIKGDMVMIFFNFSIAILFIIIGLIFLNRVSFPHKNAV